MAYSRPELIKDKDHLLTRARKSKKEDDKINARRARNLVNALIKRARSDFVKEQLDTHRNDPKKFWEIVKNVSGDNSSKSPLYLTDEDNNPVPDTNIAEHVNSFFTQIGLKLANTINEVPNLILLIKETCLLVITESTLLSNGPNLLLKM